MSTVKFHDSYCKYCGIETIRFHCEKETICIRCKDEKLKIEEEEITLMAELYDPDDERWDLIFGKSIKFRLKTEFETPNELYIFMQQSQSPGYRNKQNIQTIRNKMFNMIKRYIRECFTNQSICKNHQSHVSNYFKKILRLSPTDQLFTMFNSTCKGNEHPFVNDVIKNFVKNQTYVPTDK